MLLIISLPLIVFGRAMMPGYVFSPADLIYHFFPWAGMREVPWRANPVFSDVSLVFHPWLIHAAREIGSWRFPLWNPHVFAGTPFLGNAQSALFSPFTALAYVFPLRLALALAAASKIIVAGLGTYWFLRLLNLRPLSALTGAVAFMFNGFVVAWLSFSLVSVAVWLPLLFAVTERLRRTLSWRSAGLLGLVVGVQFTGGHPETCLHVLSAVSLYALYRALRSDPARFLAKFFGAVIIGTALAGVQLLPFVEYLLESSILVYRTESMPQAVFGFEQYAALLAPSFTYENGEIGGVGVAPWLLIPCALLGAWRKFSTAFFSVLAGVCVAAIFENPLFPSLLSALPGFSLSANSRLVLILAFCLAALSAAGMEVVLDPPPGKRKLLAWSSLVFAGSVITAVLARPLPANGVNAVAISPNGRLAATADMSGAARIWDAGSGRMVHVLWGHHRALGVSFSPDGKLLATSGCDGTVRLWDVGTGGLLSVLRVGRSFVWSVAFDPKGTVLAASSGDGKVWLWDYPSLAVREPLTGHDGEVASVAFHSNGRLLVTGGADGTARVWDVASGNEVRTLRGHSGEVCYADFSPGGRHIVTAGRDGTIRLWDSSSGRERRVIRAHGGAVWAADIVAGDERLVTGSADGQVRLWDLETGNRLREWRGRSGDIWGVAVDDARGRVLIGTEQGLASMRDLASGRDLGSYEVIGRESLRVAAHRRQAIVAAGIFALLGIAGVVLVRSSLRAGGVAVVGLWLVGLEIASVVPLALFHNPVVKLERFYPVPDAVSFLREQDGVFRVALPVPNLGGLYGLSDVSGYDAMSPRRLEVLFHQDPTLGVFGNAPLMFPAERDSLLLDLLNVKFILLDPSTPSPGRECVPVYRGPDGIVYRNTDCLPRAFLVGRARVFAEDAGVLEAIRAGEIDFRNELALVGREGDDSPSAKRVKPGEAVIEDYRAEKVSIKTKSSGPAYLVLTDRHAPGWEAEVDGEPAEIVRANYCFRAVHLEAGEHVVEFRYRPLSFRLGLTLSCAALLVLLALVWRFPARPRLR